MSLTAIKFIATVDQYNGSPGFESTMQTIKQNFHNLTGEEKMLFADFEEDILNYAIAYFKERNLNPLKM